MTKDNIGTEEGDLCGRPWLTGVCTGTMQYFPDNPDDCCSCHLHPPCSYCTDQHLQCTECNALPDEE